MIPSDEKLTLEQFLQLKTKETAGTLSEWLINEYVEILDAGERMHVVDGKLRYCYTERSDITSIEELLCEIKGIDQDTGQEIRLHDYFVPIVEKHVFGLLIGSDFASFEGDECDEAEALIRDYIWRLTENPEDFIGNESQEFIDNNPLPSMQKFLAEMDESES